MRSTTDKYVPSAGSGSVSTVSLGVSSHTYVVGFQVHSQLLSASLKFTIPVVMTSEKTRLLVIFVEVVELGLEARRRDGVLDTEALREVNPVPSTVKSGTGPQTTGLDCEIIATQKYRIFLCFVYTVWHVGNFV